MQELILNESMILFSQKSICAGLSDPFFRDKIRFFDSIASTNTYAKQIAEDGAEAGTVVIAEEQIGGRGQYDRKWHSPPYVGLWLTLICRPQLPPFRASELPLLAADLLLPVFESYSSGQFSIKRPNDILSNGKKVCGILCESAIQRDVLQYVVVGIGVNINQTSEDFPAELQNQATSLYLITGQRVARIELLNSILQIFKTSQFLPGI